MVPSDCDHIHRSTMQEYTETDFEPRAAGNGDKLAFSAGSGTWPIEVPRPQPTQSLYGTAHHSHNNLTKVRRSL